MNVREELRRSLPWGSLGPSQGSGGESEGWAELPAGLAGAQDHYPGATQVSSQQLRPRGGAAAGLCPGSALPGSHRGWGRQQGRDREPQEPNPSLTSAETACGSDVHPTTSSSWSEPTE